MGESERDSDAVVEAWAPNQVAIAIFLALALYNVIELTFIIFFTFRKWSGLYFWSFVVSTSGIALYSIGFLLKQLKLSNEWILFVTLISVGWCTMVTGQSIVLYSRLHILVRNRRVLQLVLGMIIVDAIICHLPILVLVYGSNSPNHEPFDVPYSVYEKIQVTIFFFQELIISSLYIFQTVILQQHKKVVGGNGRARRAMNHLIGVNTLVIGLDVTIVVLEYTDMYDIQTAYKALVYAVKLKLEFSILNRLVDVTQAPRASEHGYLSPSRSGTSTIPLTALGCRLSPTGGFGWGDHKAFVHAGVRTAAEEAQIPSGRVMKTTEVTVHREPAAGS